MGCGLAGDGLMGGDRVSDGLASRNQRYRVLRLMWWCWAIAASEAPGCLHVSTMWALNAWLYWRRCVRGGVRGTVFMCQNQVRIAFTPLTQVIVAKAVQAACIGKQSGNTILRLALRAGLFRHCHPPDCLAASTEHAQSHHAVSPARFHGVATLSGIRQRECCFCPAPAAQSALAFCQRTK